MDHPRLGRRFPGFYDFGPLALARAEVDSVTAWGGTATGSGAPRVGFDVRCRNGMALVVALDGVRPGEAVATPFMADRARVVIRQSGASGPSFAEQDVESALALVAMVCAGTG